MKKIIGNPNQKQSDAQNACESSDIVDQFIQLYLDNEVKIPHTVIKELNKITVPYLLSIAFFGKHSGINQRIIKEIISKEADSENSRLEVNRVAEHRRKITFNNEGAIIEIPNQKQSDAQSAWISSVVTQFIQLYSDNEVKIPHTVIRESDKITVPYLLSIAFFERHSGIKQSIMKEMIKKEVDSEKSRLQLDKVSEARKKITFNNKDVKNEKPNHEQSDAQSANESTDPVQNEEAKNACEWTDVVTQLIQLCSRTRVTINIHMGGAE